MERLSRDVIARRQFLSVCGCAAAGVLAGCASLATFAVPAENDRLRIRIGDYPELGRAGGAVRLAPQGRREMVYVLADEQSAYIALSPICTHRGCTVEVRGARLVCPCHGSTYDRSGSVLRGPAERPLYRYPLTKSGDVLEIDLRGAPG